MKKIISIALAAIMVASISVVSFSAATVQTPGGSSTDTQVTLTYGYSKNDTDPDSDPIVTPGSDPEEQPHGHGGSHFEVTVPTKLPFVVDAENNVETASNAFITNASAGPVKVTGIELNTATDWEIMPAGTDFTQIPVNSKKYTMSIFGADAVRVNGSATKANFTPATTPVINGGNGELQVTYGGKFAVQSAAMNETEIGKVTFVVDWNTAA